LSSENQPKLSLRERKKAKTRAVIQQNALRLFHEQGYADTTVEQIAEASEISPSTFFRYFPTKESVILYDDYDPLLIEAFQQQPIELPTIQAFRRAVKAGFVNIPEDEKRALQERMQLVMSVPELRVASFNQLADTSQMIMELVAEREGRDKSDQEILTFAGALMGAIISSQFYCFQHPEVDLIDAIDNALAFLEAGLPLSQF
jgi:AcrR family transcriptional regulator